MDLREDYDADVLIVGAGPMGATAALALATYGVRATLITRYPWLSNSPRAHITNQRAMEVFRDLEISAQVRRAGSPWELMGETPFVASLAGREFARVRSWGTGDERHGDYVRSSPEPVVDLIQPKLEAILVENAAARGAMLSFNTEYVALTQDDGGVTARLRDRLTGREFDFRARYLIGADGARSRVAEDIGLPFEGEMGRAHTAYVQFTADLGRYMAHRPSILTWVLSDDTAYGEIGMGLLRAVRPWDKWIAGWGYDAQAGDPDLSAATVTERVRTMVGDPALELTIDATSTWQVNQAYATVYSRGRVFCGGDAVHRHPPSGGLGSNTSVQDAFNLAWKLAYAIRGDAGPDLLESYSAERAPVGRQVVLRANRSRVEFGAIREALTAEGTTGIGAALSRIDDPGPVGVRARSTLHAALEAKNYEFNALGVESNQRYASTAVDAEASETEETDTVDPELFAIPTSRPGAKIPHAWLVDGRGEKISILDRVGRGGFALVTGLSGTAWRDAVDELALPYLRAVVIDGPETRDLYGSWARVREIPESGALLIRPDGYVAWRRAGSARSAHDARESIRAALNTILGRTT